MLLPAKLAVGGEVLETIDISQAHQELHHLLPTPQYEHAYSTHP